MLRNVTARIADNPVTPTANGTFNMDMYPLYILSIVKYFVDKAARHYSPLFDSKIYGL
jgi:hypothetical protein